MVKRRNQSIVNELHNVIHAVTLAKVGILSPMILHLEEIQEITKHEHERFTMIDLLDVSNIKIVQNKHLIVIFIKYPITEKLCKYFEVRSLSQKGTKLIIPETVKCGNKYKNVENCK